MINNTNNWKRNVSCFLTAQTISLFGSSLVQYAIVWYITLTTSSGKMLTLSTLCCPRSASHCLPACGSTATTGNG